MVRKNWLVLGVLLFCFSLMKVVSAEALTEQQVRRFIESMPQATALAEKHDDGERKNIDPSRPLSSGLELMNGQGPAYDDLAELALLYGFSSPEQWADVGDRVIAGYPMASSEATVQSVKDGYQAGRRNVENDASLTPEQKTRILAGMEKGYSRNLTRMESAEQDLPAIRTNLSALKELLE